LKFQKNKFFRETLISGHENLLWLIMAASIVTSIVDVFAIVSVGLLVSNQLYGSPHVTFGQDPTLLLDLKEFLLIPINGFIAISLSFFLNLVLLRVNSYFAVDVASCLSNKLFNLFLRKNVVEVGGIEHSEFAKNIVQETYRLAMAFLQPGILLLSGTVSLSVILLGLSLQNPSFMFLISTIFASIYGIIYFISKKKLKGSGKMVSDMYRERMGLLTDASAGLYDIHELRLDDVFRNRFGKTSEKLTRALGDVTFFSQVPRISLDAIIYFSILVLFVFFAGDEEVIGSVIFLAAAAMKVLPLVQKIFHSFAQMTANKIAFEELEEFYKKLECMSDEKGPVHNPVGGMILRFDSIRFSYPGDKKILGPFSFEIMLHGVNVIFGPSGIGKSSLINLFKGRLSIISGAVYLDDRQIDDSQLYSIFSGAIYAGQKNYIFNLPIPENISAIQKVDDSKIESVLETASLSRDVIEEFWSNSVGPNAERLSGGQRQRLLIARTIMQTRSIYIFDEITSALDKRTARLVVNRLINNLEQKLLIFITHDEDLFPEGVNLVPILNGWYNK
jgi:ABC-type bacteriocin/lantibiotic exporter with double-glycine peptidase domain